MLEATGRLLPLLTASTLIASCALVYDYGDYKDAASTSTGNTASASGSGGQGGGASASTASVGGSTGVGGGGGAICDGVCNMNPPADTRYVYIPPPAGLCAAGFKQAPYDSCAGTCTCNNNPGTCSVQTLGLYDASCVTKANSATPPGLGCLFSFNLPNYAVKVHFTPNNDAKCTPQDPLPSADKLSVCIAGNPCSNGVCVPNPPSGQTICQLISGDKSCPPKTSKKLVYMDDGMHNNCTCSCNQTMPACDASATVTVTSYSGNGCTGAMSSVMAPADVCTPGPAMHTSIGNLKASPNMAQASCSNTATPLAGAQIETLCCPN